MHLYKKFVSCRFYYIANNIAYIEYWAEKICTSIFKPKKKQNKIQQKTSTCRPVSNLSQNDAIYLTILFVTIPQFSYTEVSNVMAYMKMAAMLNTLD